jgi:hypothetical protein
VAVARPLRKQDFVRFVALARPANEARGNGHQMRILLVAAAVRLPAIYAVRVNVVVSA